MKVFIALSLLVATASAGVLPRLPQLELMTPQELEDRIINGELAKPGQFPYQAGLSLQIGDKTGWCGGTLISDRWVLTAAHCTTDADGVTVYLGAIDIKDSYEAGQQRIYVSKKNIIVHEGWDANTVRNDISLIKLPLAVKFNDRIQPATLPKKTGHYSTYVGDLAWTSGWGKESNSSPTVSQFLRYFDAPVIKKSTCSVYYLGIITDNMICISGKDSKSVCNGDSGGPLVYKENDTNYLIGVTSFVIGLGCEAGWPPVFTRVTSYLDWIEEVSGVVNE